MKVLLELLRIILIFGIAGTIISSIVNGIYKLGSDSVWLARLDCDTAFIIRLV